MVGAAGFEPATLWSQTRWHQAALRPDCSTNTADKSKFKGYNSYKILINLIFNAIRDLMIIECPICNKKFNLN